MPQNDFLNKNDLTIILEVNKKAVEIQAATASQNEEIINQLDKLEKSLEESGKKIEGIEKTLFKLQIIIVAGLIPILLEAVKLFLSK